MPRSKYETLESIEKRINEIENEKKVLAKTKAELADKDNARLGKLARNAFRKELPVQKSEQILFFKAVADTYRAAVKNGTAVDWHQLVKEQDNVTLENETSSNETSSNENVID